MSSHPPVNAAPERADAGGNRARLQHDVERMVRSLNEAQRIARLGSWEWHIQTGELWWSDQVYRIFGNRPQAFTPTYAAFLESIHPEDRDHVEAAITASVEDPAIPYGIQHRIIRPDGLVRHVHEIGEITRDADGRPVHMLGTVLDVTERVLVEETLRASQEAMAAALDRQRASLEAERKANRQLLELQEMKAQFLAAVSHELRTPLTVVLGVAESLSSLPCEATTSADLVTLLQRNAHRLEALLQDLLDVNRLSRGELVATKDPVDIEDIVRMQVQATTPPGREVHLTTEQATLRVDIAQVERIVVNLMSNAVRYSPDDSPIDVVLTSADDGVEFRVMDRGPGVPDALKQRVFEPFERGEIVERHAPGAGVGLALVDAFARLHGGRAWLEDRPGGGTIAAVRLSRST